MISSANEHINCLVGGIIGTRDYIEEFLLNKGLSDFTVSIVISKIESIIAASGELGRLLQHDVDYEELKNLHLQIDQLTKRGEFND